ncbi:interferon-induced protein with tetratricopeptide repeats 5-like [Falco biarmicus]|uniref:interferon-induced protein with tetratricopeptide repeats 5 n=1 Tax=Falco cherrug TaxID=345164 RepID=UPI000392EF81|nr:interferon-induced protein with tetratricopeptide repeats 5 [Falco cherrug]XP_037256687.1 interferon-induced protein with tetratricopeptide repeats 5-like [Falco rusticolus]XP_056209062.1 interferon-induced protein with tetratricopeptide repeats 5-like [Falco biarmicus]
MSTISKNSLKSSLLKLECHFTWTLLKQDVDLDDLEETIGDQIEFLTKSNIRNYNLLSYICHLKNSNEEALRNLQTAEELVKKHHPDEAAKKSLVTWGNYAWIYYHMKRYEEAQTYVSKVEKSCKKLSSTAHWKVQLPDIYAEQGWALLKFGRKYYERAKNCFENALKNEPNNPEFNTGYAIAMYRLEEFSCRPHEDVSAPSLQPLKRAVELNPNDTFIMALLALKLQDYKQVDEGERYIEEAMQKTPDLPYFLRYAAKFYRRKGEVDKALEILKRALSVTPKSAFLHHQLGLCYRAKLYHLKKTTRYPPQEQLEELIRLSIFHFKTATDQKTKFFSAYTDLASMYAEKRMYKEAEEAFQKALDTNIMLYDDKQQFYYLYGNYQRFHMKSESEAIRCYLEGLKIEKESHARNNCSDALKKLLEQRVRRGLEDATDFGALGRLHNLNGEKHKAIECYEKAMALCPNNEEYLSALCELRLSISS